MDFIYLFFAILVIFIIWKIFLFVFKGGNFHLIPRNITRVYKTVKNKFKNEYDDNTELFFITGMINAKMYIRKDKNLIERIYFAAKLCSSLKKNDDHNSGDEFWNISNFSQILMQEYFLQDSKMSASEIKKIIWSKAYDIDESVREELESKKYFPENVIKESISIIKGYYSYFKLNKK